MTHFHPFDESRANPHNRHRLALVAALLVLSIAFPPVPVRSQSPASKTAGLVGKVVVRRFQKFTLRGDEGAVIRKPILQGYRVEGVDKGRLQLRGIVNGVTGWASASDVIPLDEAMAFCNRQIHANPKDAFSHLMRAMVQEELNQEYDKAIADYNQAIRLSPSADAYGGRGRAWGAKKEFDKAIEDFNRAIRLDPDHFLAHKDRGVTWLRKRDYDKAIADYNEAIRLNPNDSEDYAFRGVAWRFKQDYDKAIADYNEAIRLNPGNAVFHEFRAGAWQAKQDFDKAIADYTEAIRLAPDSASNYSRRANVFWQAGRYRECLADEKRFLEKKGWRDKSSPYAAIVGHFAARRTGDEAEARRFLDDLKSKGDTTAWPYPVARYLRGELGEQGLLILSINNDRLTESHCYVGLDLLIKEKISEAKTHFLWVKEHGNPVFTEYPIALAELDRLESAKP